MLDGGSSVSSITEDLLISIINEQRVMGVRLDDKRHPVRALEEWTKRERVSGVTNGQTISVRGAAVLRVRMLETGSDSKGPDVDIRFKIMSSEGTGSISAWVGLILGAPFLDGTKRERFGFIPSEHAHVMTTLGISMARLDSPGSGQYRRDGVFGQLVDSHRVFATRHSVVGSESEEDEQEHAYASGAVQDGPGLTAGAALVYDGDESIVLCQDDGALVPSRVAEPLPDDSTSVHAVLASTGGPDIVPGL